MVAFERHIARRPARLGGGRRRRQLHAGLRPGRRPRPAAGWPTSRPGCAAVTGRCPKRSTGSSTDRVSDLLLAPSPDGVENLRAEGYAERPDRPRRQRHDRHPAGQPGAGPIAAGAGRARARRPKEYGLLTLHRPANVDDPAILAGLIEAVNTVGRAAADGVPGPPPDRQPSCPTDRLHPEYPGHRAPRLPRLPRPAGRGPAGADRLRRPPGGDHGARGAVPDPAGEHRATDHHHRGHQPPGRPRPGRHRGRRRASARHGVEPRCPDAVGRSTPATVSPRPSNEFDE